MKSILIIITIFMVIIASENYGQSNISGFIYDKETGEALIGANVFIKEISVGASTNLSGYFVIPNVSTGSYTLIATYVGYSSKKQKIKTINNEDIALEINLTPKSIETGEVVVSSESDKISINLFNKPISSITITGVEVSNMPGLIEPDLLRVLQTVPGVTSASDYSAGIYVRGGTPDQNLFLIDGSDVYNPEHAFGIFSTFNTDAIKKVEFFKGGFGAEYGGRLSSVVNVINLDGNRENIEGVVNIGTLSASTTLQFPLGKLGSISGSFRRTYLEFIKGLMNIKIPDYYFYDGNIKTFLNLSSSDKLSISFFRGEDNLKIDGKEFENVAKFKYNWGNTTGSINWRHIFSPKLFSSFWLTGSRFKSNFNLLGENFKEVNNLDDMTAKASFEYYHSQKLFFKAGAEYKLIKQKYDETENTTQILINQKSSIINSYLIAILKPNVLWDIELGLRALNYRGDIKATKFAPRFSLKYRLTETTNLKLNSGIYYQFVNRIPRLFFSSIWTLADKNTPISKSTHFSFGLQKTFGSSWEFEAETYFKDYKDISQYNFYVNNEIKPTKYENGKFIFTDTKGVFINGNGKSYGFEITLRKNAGVVSGWASYAYTKTNYKFKKLNNGLEFSPRHDRNSTINGGITTELTPFINSIANVFGSDKKLNLGVYYIYTSGQPITIPTSTYYVQNLPDWRLKLNNQYTLNPGGMNQYRLPFYSRLDINLSYKKQYEGWSLEIMLQVFNILNRKNVWFISYEQSDNSEQKTQKVESVNMFPILPSLNVRLKF